MFVGIVYALIFSLASANENIPSPLAFDVVSSLDKRRTLFFVSALRRGVTPVVSRLTGWLRPPSLFVLTSSKARRITQKGANVITQIQLSLRHFVYPFCRFIIPLLIWNYEVKPSKYCRNGEREYCYILRLGQVCLCSFSISKLAAQT